MEETLTQGAIGKMLNGEVTSEKETIPVIQVTELKHTVSYNTKEKTRWKVMLSDGTHLLQGMLSSTLNTFMEQGFLQRGSIVRLTRFVCNVIHGRNFVIVSNLDVISNPNDTSGFDAPISSKPPVMKQDVLKKMKAFRERLSGAKLFIRDTRTSKDQVRATIRCFNKLINSFNNVWEDFSGVEDEFELIQRVVQPSSDDSEELSCDQLRSNACILLKFFREMTLKSFVKSFSPFVTTESGDTKKALLAIQKVVEEGDSLVYRVMYEGFDCRNISKDEDDDDEDEW